MLSSKHREGQTAGKTLNQCKKKEMRVNLHTKPNNKRWMTQSQNKWEIEEWNQNHSCVSVYRDCPCEILTESSDLQSIIVSLCTINKASFSRQRGPHWVRGKVHAGTWWYDINGCISHCKKLLGIQTEVWPNSQKGGEAHKSHWMYSTMFVFIYKVKLSIWSILKKGNNIVNSKITGNFGLCLTKL